MADKGAALRELMRLTGYSIVQIKGQRIFGPPPNWYGPPPPKGCEVFVGRVPQDVFEDELVPIFAVVGKIFQMRLIMNFSGYNRGYAFVTYTNRADAVKAVRLLNWYEVRAGRHIIVVESVDNCKLFIKGIPKTKSHKEVVEELSKHVVGIFNVILYKSYFNRRLNRGYVIVEFTSHQFAMKARKELFGRPMLWDHQVTVSWAFPDTQPSPDACLN